MIHRFYVHNLRCLENFDLPISGLHSALLIGNNGSGKSTVGAALIILQRIARGTNRVSELVQPKDFARGRDSVPMRFELEVLIGSKLYAYVLALELPRGFKELRVKEESLRVDGAAVYSREVAMVTIEKAGKAEQATFSLDWHLVALPVLQQASTHHPLHVFRQWLAEMLILRPAPSLILGESSEETLQPSIDVHDFGAWFAGVIAHAPSAYSKLDAYMKQVMDDFADLQNPSEKSGFRRLKAQFAKDGIVTEIPFEDLSDGEKCFFICALVLAANSVQAPLFCFWDEPDNYLALSEVGHFVTSLRKGFQQGGGQFIATSHNPEAIRSFSYENTFLLARKSHLEPTIVRSLSGMDLNGDLVGAMIRGDLD